MKLRTLIHAADPQIVEDWKWGQPAFMHNGKPLCWVWAFSKHVTFTFYQGALMKDSQKLFNYGDTNLQNWSIKFTNISEINETALIAYIKEAVQLNEAGKQVKISVSKDKTVVIPPYIKKVLQREGLLEKYNQQIYTYRKGYAQWIEGAKRQETKDKRMRQMIRELKERKVYMGMPRSS